MPELLSSSEIIRCLKKHGFIFVSQRGSHKKFKKDGRIVIVPDPKKGNSKRNICIHIKAIRPE